MRVTTDEDSGADEDSCADVVVFTSITVSATDML
jgi:hypothetical protein